MSDPKPTLTAAQQAVAEKAIEGFDFEDYGLDNVSYGIREQREDQDWIAHLATAVGTAVLAGQSGDN